MKKTKGISLVSIVFIISLLLFVIIVTVSLVENAKKNQSEVVYNKNEKQFFEEVDKKLGIKESTYENVVNTNIIDLNIINTNIILTNEI